MRTTLLTALCLALPGVALAHPGHVAPLAGHAHPLPMIALAGLLLGAALLLALAARGRA